MQINVSSSQNIDGTLILPLYEGTDIVPEAHATGLHVALKSQINRVLDDEDFKG